MCSIFPAVSYWFGAWLALFSSVGCVAAVGLKVRVGFSLVFAFSKREENEKGGEREPSRGGDAERGL